MEIAIPAPDFVGHLERRLRSELARDAEDWSEALNALTKWEDDHLLDNPTPEALEAHKKTLKRLLSFGRFITLSTAHPDFPDRETASMVAATLSALKDKLSMWHGPRMTKAESDKILAACFPE